MPESEGRPPMSSRDIDDPETTIIKTDAEY